LYALPQSGGVFLRGLSKGAIYSRELSVKLRLMKKHTVKYSGVFLIKLMGRARPKDILMRFVFSKIFSQSSYLADETRP
jgi:hypothetical protein